ncbi:hypothetical protein ACFL3H_08930 [Gemmatimonadota bacterium]
MLKQSIAVFVACALLFQVCGCSTMRMISVHEVEDGYINGKVLVTTFDGAGFVGDQPIAQVRSDTLYIVVEGQHRLVALSDIKTLYAKKFAPVVTVLALIGGAYATFLVSFALIPGISF